MESEWLDAMRVEKSCPQYLKGRGGAKVEAEAARNNRLEERLSVQAKSWVAGET